MNMISETVSMREATTTSKKVNNYANPLHINALTYTAMQVDKIRKVRKVTINSMYRSIELNKLVGGSKISQHCKGEAVDLCDVVSNYELAKFIEKNMDFDQIILEKGSEMNPEWIHVSFKERGNRRQVLRFDGNNYQNYKIK